MPIQRRVWKQGNSLVITIPRYMGSKHGLEKGKLAILQDIDGKGILVSGAELQAVRAREDGMER